MMWRLSFGIAGPLVLFLAAGCGGGGGKGVFTLSATRSCLQKSGFQTTVLANDYLPGSGGNLRVRLTHEAHLLQPNAPSGGGPQDEYVFLVFAKDPTAALATQDKAVTLAVNSFRSRGILMTRAAVKKGVGLSNNVFYYSANGPLNKGERAKVESCLR
jgi:hypothetical protein